MLGELGRTGRATIIVKAAPRVGKTHGELVCCAGIDPKGLWVRLYPVAFRTLDDAQKFGRWDIVSYNWSLPRDDQRAESRRVKHRSVKIEGHIRKAEERIKLAAPLVVTSLVAEEKQGKSFAFLRPTEPRFFFIKKALEDYEAEKEQFRAWHQQEVDGLFGFMSKGLVPYEPSPYQFRYRYKSADGDREGTCQDWEIEATFLKWRRRYGEQTALKYMNDRFGAEYAEHGFVFAMGTHKAYGNWLINGIVKLPHGAEANFQKSLFN